MLVKTSDSCASAVEPIQESQSAKVDSRLLVMQVMFLRENREKVISTVCNHRFHRSYRPKQETGDDVTAQDLWRKPEWQNCGEEIFQWVRILGGKSDRSFELMMLVVYALVEGPDMQQAMGIVEDDLAAENAKDDVAGDLIHRRYDRIEAIERMSREKT